MYLWEKQRHPEYNGTLSEYLRDPPDRTSYAAERADARKNYVQKWVQHVRSWQSVSKTQLIRFEDILETPHSVVEKIAEYVDLRPALEKPLLPEKRSSMGRWSDYWSRLIGDYESTAILGRPNGNQSLDWQEVFSDDDRRYVHDIAGELLIELGYEKDVRWVDQ
jgi:hypothetical protein